MLCYVSKFSVLFFALKSNATIDSDSNDGDDNCWLIKAIHFDSRFSRRIHLEA